MRQSCMTFIEDIDNDSCKALLVYLPKMQFAAQAAQIQKSKQQRDEIKRLGTEQRQLEDERKRLEEERTQLDREMKAAVAGMRTD